MQQSQSWTQNRIQIHKISQIQKQIQFEKKIKPKSAQIESDKIFRVGLI